MNTSLKTSAILLAGGLGSRMQSTTPKQFLELGGKPLVSHSFDLFLSIPEIDEIIVVCPTGFESLFPIPSSKPVVFALPGERRQDSVYNGFQMTSHGLICIHDAARPFIDKQLVLSVLELGKQYGAVAAGVPIKFTVKETDEQNFVKHTPDRTKIWEIQTPQVLHKDILTQGFEYAHRHGITVTDDVSLAELIGRQVKIAEGSHTNLKITVPSDLAIAHHLHHTYRK